jgi:hypothetical protein
MKNLEKILGGKTEIRNNATTWDIRTKNAPLLDQETQPILYGIAKKCAEMEGCTVEEFQNKSR